MSVRETKAQLAASLITAELQLRAQQVLLAKLREDRVFAYQRFRSCSAEKASYKHQRDEVVAALAELIEALDVMVLDELPHEEFVAAVGLPLPLGRMLVERYRRPAPAGRA